MTLNEIQMILDDFDKAEDGNDYLNIIENHEMLLRKVLEQALEIAKGDMVLVPREPTTQLLKAMLESKARDAEGEFESLGDHLDYSGQNKCYTVVKEAYQAMIKAYEEGK